MTRALKNWLIYVFARIAVAMVGLVPARLVAPISRALGDLAHLVAGAERRLARRQLVEALGVTEARAVLLSRGVFFHLARNAVELCRLRRARSVMPRIAFAPGSKERLDLALSGDKGVVFATGHLGNWELMAAFLAREGYPVSTISKASYDARFTRLIDGARARLGVSVIHRDAPGAAAGMLRALRAGRILGLLIDQDTRVQGAFVPFFGRLAHTPTGAAILASRTGAAMVVGTVRRRAAGDHVVEIADARALRDEIDSTAALSAEIERRIRRHPSQWVWFHRRWRTRPPDTAANPAEEAAA